MRVVVVVHYFAPHIGGMEAVAEAQATSLASAGHDVTVLTCAHERRLRRKEQAPPGYVIERSPALNIAERRFGVTFPIIFPGFLVRAWLRVRGADVLHLHDVFYLTSHLAALVAILHRKPFFVTQHVAMVDHPSKFVVAVQRLVYRLAGAPILRRAEKIVVYNTNVRDHLLGLGVRADRILLHHNGIDTAWFCPVTETERAELRRIYGRSDDRPVILFVGRLVPKKGFDLVAAARSPQWTTVIAGPGPIPADLADDANLVWFGPADRNQVRDLYRLSDVFVFPAVGEIFTLAMQEAMACGLPVVTFDDPGYASYDFDRTSVWFVDRTVEAVQAGIERVLLSTEEGRWVAASSRRVALERFSWDSNVATELALYEGAFRGRPHRDQPC